MMLYLVRHGQAVDSSVDPARPLSDAGLLEAEALADFVRGISLRVPTVWQSGKERAKQTAEILVDRGALKGTLVEKAGLAPNAPVEPIAHEARSRREDLCIVGHLPFLSNLVAHLAGEGSAGTMLAFQPCGMLCLEGDSALDDEAPGGGDWWIRWFVTPEILPSP